MLYVEAALSLGTALRRRRDRLAAPEADLREVGERILVWRPPLILPLGNSCAPVRRCNALVVSSLLRRLAARYDFIGGCCVCLLPPAADLVDALAPWAVAFDLADDYASWPGQNRPAREVASRQTAALVGRANVCFAVSQRLVEAYGRRAERMVLLTNGVEYERFARATLGPLPAELASLRRPIVGFAGMIHEFVDLDLIASLARAHPEISIVMVGPLERDPDPVRGLANVHLLGFRPYDELPDYIAGFDVAVLPWARTVAAEAANPAKIWQYLAAGKPTVATLLPDLEPLRDVVRLADGPGAFVHEVESALREDGPERVAHRQERARAQDWDVKTDVLEAELDRIMRGWSEWRQGR